MANVLPVVTPAFVKEVSAGVIAAAVDDATLETLIAAAQNDIASSLHTYRNDARHQMLLANLVRAQLEAGVSEEVAIAEQYERSRRLLFRPFWIGVRIEDGDAQQIVPINPQHHIFVLVGDDATFTAADIPAGTRATGNAGAVPAYTGQMYVAVLRPVSAGRFHSIFLYAQGVRNTSNVIGAFTQQSATIRYEGLEHYVLVSNNALAAPMGYTLIAEVE